MTRVVLHSHEPDASIYSSYGEGLSSSLGKEFQGEVEDESAGSKFSVERG
jgi:hypothetical protein